MGWHDNTKIYRKKKLKFSQPRESSTTKKKEPSQSFQAKFQQEKNSIKQLSDSERILVSSIEIMASEELHVIISNVTLSP